MAIEVYTSKGVVAFRSVGEAMKGTWCQAMGGTWTNGLGVHLTWKPIPASRYERPVGVVIRDGKVKETCLVKMDGHMFYREARTFGIVADSPEVQADIAGRLVPAPRSSRPGLWT